MKAYQNYFIQCLKDPHWYNKSICECLSDYLFQLLVLLHLKNWLNCFNEKIKIKHLRTIKNRKGEKNLGRSKKSCHKIDLQEICIQYFLIRFYFFVDMFASIDVWSVCINDVTKLTFNSLMDEMGKIRETKTSPAFDTWL